MIENIMQKAQSWAITVTHDAQSRIASKIDTGELFNTLESVVKERRDGSIRISFKLPRYGVYVEKGAGRGFGGTKGSTWYTKNKEKRTTNPKSLNKMGTGSRPAHPFLNPAIIEALPQLEEDLVGFYSNIVTNALIK